MFHPRFDSAFIPADRDELLSSVKNCVISSPEYPKEMPTSIIKALISFANMFMQNVIIRYVLLWQLFGYLFILSRDVNFDVT